MRNEVISTAMNIILTELPVFPGSSKFGASSLSRRHSWAYIELYFGSSRAFSKTLKFKIHISTFCFYLDKYAPWDVKKEMLLWDYQRFEFLQLLIESEDETLNCDQSNESYWAILSCGTVYYAVQGGSNYRFFGWNPKLWPVKWKLLSNTFLWYCLLCCTRWFKLSILWVKP